MNESHKRSIVKTIIWRFTGTGATFIISMLVTGDLQAASGIAVIQLTANTVLYYIYERIWTKIDWGRN